MNFLKQSATKHPILHGLLVILAFEIAMFAISFAVVLVYPRIIDQGEFVTQSIIELMLTGVGIGLVAIYGYNSIWKEKGSGFLKGFLASGYFIAVSLLSLVTSLFAVTASDEWEAVWKICFFVACVFLIGICEETFYRGVLANFFYDRYACDSAGVWTATIWSGMLFGLMHLSNMLGATDGQFVVGVLVQVFSACTMGMALSAIYFRCRNIWVLAIVHGFVDFCGAFSAGFLKGGSLTATIGSYTPAMFISAMPFLIVTLVLLRPSKVKQIIDYRRAQQGLPVFGGKIISSERSKRSLRIAIIVSVIIAVILFVTTLAFYNDYRK